MSRRDDLLAAKVRRRHRELDRRFALLLLAQWVFAIGLALAISPWSYDGPERSLHVHVKLAIALGAVINALPLTLIYLRPGWWLTRQSVAVAQMLWSAMLIMVTGGRIETHFHVFGSLAFLAVYRDWTMLPTATVVVVADGLLRGMWWPESVYGTATAEWWRFLEHAAWIAFEDVVLIYVCIRAVREMRADATRQARLERMKDTVEREVVLRTRELEHSMRELQQAQKLESVGRLAAGVAHEINTPVQFVSDSVQFMRDGMTDVLAAAVQARPDDPDLAYLAEEMPKALDRAADGCGRVATIVRSMKVFAHPGGAAAAVDLNKAVESTLAIARNEYRYVADLETELDPELPRVTCNAGEINQALLNIVLNGAQAIGEVVRDSGARGKLTVRTARDGEHAVISVADTGGGIPEELHHRIFDPFFTTKPVGAGSGQGLAIARAVIVKQHRGRLTFESTVGAGTTFHIRIPVAHAA